MRDVRAPVKAGQSSIPGERQSSIIDLKYSINLSNEGHGRTHELFHDKNKKNKK